VIYVLLVILAVISIVSVTFCVILLWTLGSTTKELLQYQLADLEHKKSDPRLIARVKEALRGLEWLR
jgi:hypothetical protein